MTDTWSIARRDADAGRWLEVSRFGFWLRHPEALSAKLPGRPEGIEEQANLFRRFGSELYALEHDLTECLNEFKTAYEVLYRDPKDLGLKKFAIVYHTDNFHVRAHKLIENVYGLLGLVVGLDPTKRPAPGDPQLREQVRNSAKPEAIVSRLNAFQGNSWMKQAVEERNRFVHRYREEPEWEWSMLAPVSRTLELEHNDDIMARELRQMAEPNLLDGYADRKADDLLQTLEVIQNFRDDLEIAFLDEFVKLLLTMPGEIRTRFQFIVDLRDLWSSI